MSQEIPHSTIDRQGGWGSSVWRILAWGTFILLIFLFVLASLIPSLRSEEIYQSIVQLVLPDFKVTHGWVMRTSNYGHSFVFVLLSITAWAAFGRRVWRGALVVFCMAFGGEVLQMLAPTRSSNWKDVMFNLIGLTVGTLMVICFEVLVLRPRHRDRQRSI